MQTLPQELVDKVVDELLELKALTLYFDNSDELKKWCRKVTPDPAGVSRHTHRLIFIGVDTLEGCEAHIRAFTCVENVDIIGCNFLLSPSVAKCFTPMGSGLIRLWIRESETTSRIIISLLAGLHQLKSFTMIETKVTDDTSGTSVVPRIPFFEGNNSVVLHFREDQRDPPPDWIPPSARFGDLEIGTTYFLHKSVLVNQWLSGSSATLSSLKIYGDPEAFLPNPFTPLDLSPCRALERLYISVNVYRPGIIAETVLPSITSPRLSSISLHSEDDPEDDFLEADYPAWMVTENHLCRLAKRFSTENPGQKMEVVIFGEAPYELEKSHFLNRVNCTKFLPRLKEEATFSCIDLAV